MWYLIKGLGNCCYLTFHAISCRSEPCCIFLGVFAKLRKATVSVHMSVHLLVRPCGTTRPQLDGFLRNLIFEYFLKIYRQKFKVRCNLTGITNNLHEDLCTFMISRSILLGIRNIWERRLQRKSKHTCYFRELFFENCAVYEIIWKKHGTARQAAADSIIQRMRIVCRITKATGWHSEYVIFTGLPRQQWLQDRASRWGVYLDCMSFCVVSCVRHKRFQQLAIVSGKLRRIHTYHFPILRYVSPV
jgi:hypothetical protein